MAGDNVLIHCMGGRHRAPIGAAVMRAILMSESFEEARRAIEGVRNVEFHLSLPKIGGDWIDRYIAASKNLAPSPAVSVWAASVGRSHVHACRMVADDIGPVCKWNQRDALSYFKGDTLRVALVVEAKRWGRDFCRACLAKVKVSLRTAAEER